MSLSIPCPHCNQAVKIRKGRIGSPIQCPRCKKAFLHAPEHGAPESDSARETAASGVKAAPVEAEGGAGGGHGRRAARYARWIEWAVGRGADANLLVTASLGALIAAITYHVVLVPLEGTRIGTLFVHRSWTPKVMLFLCAWALLILGAKLWKLRGQRRELQIDLLPRSIGDEITSDNVAAFQAHVASHAIDRRAGFLVRRVGVALQHFKLRGSAQEVATLAGSQAEIDAVAVESSYTMLKVFIWAVPILGFIGTVEGIGLAVGAFARSAADASLDVQAVRQALGDVTSGLAIAFDATFLALALSIVLMITSNWLQKMEDDLLTAVADYCNEKLLGRLSTPAHAAGGQGDAVRIAVAEVMAAHRDSQRAWLGELAGIGSTLAGKLSAAGLELGAELRARGEAQAQALRELFASGASQRDEELRKWVAVQMELASSMGGAVRAELHSATAEFRAQLEQSGQRWQLTLTEAVGSERHGLRQALDGIERAAAGIESSAGQLREQFSRVFELVSRSMERSTTEVAAGLHQAHLDLRKSAEAEATRLASLGAALQESLGRLTNAAREDQSEAAAHRLALQRELAETSRAQLELLGSMATRTTEASQAAEQRALATHAAIQSALDALVPAVSASLARIGESLVRAQIEQSQAWARLERVLGESAVAIGKAGAATREERDEQFEKLLQRLQQLADAVDRGLPQHFEVQVSALEENLARCKQLITVQQSLASDLQATSSSRTLLNVLGELRDRVERLGARVGSTKRENALSPTRRKWPFSLFTDNGEGP